MNNFDSTICLSSKLKKNIILTISSLICKSYGPESLMTLMCTSTGKVLTTNNGMVILETLHLSHPLAKVIVQALKKQYEHTADGIKTYLLYLSQSVIELEKLEAITGTSGDHFGNKMSLQLRKIERDVLPIIWNELYSISVRKTESTLILKDLTSILNTNISSHMSRHHTNILVDLILQTLGVRQSEEKVSLVKVHRNVKFMIENFCLLHFKLPRYLIEASSTLRGFIIRRDFSYKCPHLDEISDCKFIMLQCSIEGNTREDPSETVYLKNDDSVSKSFMYRINTTRTYLQLLKKQQISVIICSQKVPDFALTLCRESEISVVSCVEEEDIQFLERISSIQAVSSPFDPIESNNIGELSMCTSKMLGTQRFVLIQFPDSLQSMIPETLVLASPTEGSVDQLADVAFKAYKSLEMCFAFQTFTPPMISSDIKCDSGDCTRFIDDSLTRKISYAKTSRFHGGKPSDDKESSSTPMFVAVGGGGFFEMKTAELLKIHSKDCVDEQTGLGCKILYDSLLSVPRTLHKQLSTNRTSESRDYLEKLQQMTRSMKEGDVCGLDKRGRVCDVVQSGILEPLASKISTLASVIQLLQQILRIDSIVSVGHLAEFQHESSDDE